MLGVQLETVVVDGMNSFLIIVFFVVSSQRKKIEKGDTEEENEKE